MTVIGIETIDYVNKSGKRICGTKFYCICHSDKDNIIGDTCESVYCSPNCNISTGIKLGDNIDVLYNKYGSVQGVILAE